MTLKAKLALLAIPSGVLLGIGAYTFDYAEGFSYFGSEPESCANCHIMNPQYDSWQKSSHHTVATCIDCHLPHSFVPKMVAKGENGFNHSKAFTQQNFHEPVMIKEKNRRILQNCCIECHRELVREMYHWDMTEPESIDCIHCHRMVGHGELPTSIGGRDRGEAEERNDE